MFIKILSKLDKAIGRVSDFGLVFSGVLILIMSLLSTYGVGRRYIFKSPEPYSYEISTMMLLGCCVFAVAGLQRHYRHLRVDFVASYFPEKIKVILVNILTPLLAMFYVGVLTSKSWENAMYSLSVGETSQSSWEEVLWPIKILVPIGMGLLFLILLSQLIKGCHTIYLDLRKTN